jgi:membrane protease YdiL (CAAX protease family)
LRVFVGAAYAQSVRRALHKTKEINMSENKMSSLFNLRDFFYKFVLILLLVHLINNTIIFLTLNTFIQNPSIPKYRLVSSVAQIITLTLFFVFVKPSAEELGIYWPDIKKSTRYLYLFGELFVFLLVISSYFIMWDIRYFALMTNIHFGITTPILEELIFRGYSWNKFREQGFSNLKTLIITSLSFGLFHLGYYYQISYATQFHPDAPSMVKIMFTKIIFATVLGLFMGLIRWKSNKVYGPIIVHSILNIIGS